MKKDISLTEIPPQQVGGHSDSEAFQNFETSKEAIRFYKILKKRLQDINNWHSFGGAMTAHFTLHNSKGQAVKRIVEKGDHLKIDIPGPGSKAGDGYDWVKVVSVKETHSTNKEKIVIKVKPCSSPLNNDPDIAHFFSKAASSVFIAARTGNKVVAEIHGRNEIPNTDNNYLLDKIRNAVIGAVGIGFFSKFQWKRLVDGLIQIKNS